MIVGRVISACFLLLLLHFSAAAQDPYYLSLNKLSGLPSNTVYDLFQDSKGFIWIANNEGLTRYDGFEFKTYINPRQTSRSGNQVEEDKYGRIWYKNFDGYLYYVEHDSLKSLKQNATIGNTGYAIIGDRLIVLQKQGIDFFDLQTMRVVKSTGLDLSTATAQLHYRNNYYIILKDSMITIGAEGIKSTVAMTATGMMAGSKNGVVFMDKDNRSGYCYEVTGSKLTKKIATPQISYMHELEYCDGKYWINTPNGVWVYDEEGRNINNDRALFADKSISSVLKDREGNFWLGTLNEGIAFVPELRTKLIKTPGMVPNILSAVNDVLFIGTKENAIYKYDINGGKFDLKYKDSLRHEMICFLADTVNHLYSFTANRFYLTDGNFKEIMRSEISIKELAVMDGKYYAVASNGMVGLMKIRDGIKSDFDSLFQVYKKDAISPVFCQFVTACRGRTVVYEPAKMTIYTGTSIGLYAITPKAITEVKHNNESIYTKKMVFYRGKVYVLTPQNQVLVLVEGKVIAPLLLAEEKEQCISMKGVGGCLYFLTNNGLRVLDTATGKVKVLTSNPGIRAEEVNDMEVVDGRLVFASERGLIVMDAQREVRDTTSPKLVINSILVNGSSVHEDMTFSYKENDVDINYSILSFNTSRKYQLFYKINDGKWQANSDVTRNLKLASLSPGEYTVSFRLESVNMDGYFAEQQVKFTISKPFWTEWWFLGGCVLLLVVGGVTYYQWRTAQLKKQNQLRVEKVELERNLRNSMLTSIRSQMNPHFFYNALNAIQSFIFADDKRNASTYLVKLSKLTRMILEMSEKESVTLDEETEALKLYLELEQMRFTADFNYELRIDSAVDSELVRIPPMIVQPYVENAVKHGLLHKKGNKYLAIEFTRNNGALRITIDDNGIGREKANELKQVKKEIHSPFATEANNRRIELLNKERVKPISIVYVDKKDNNGVAAGTTVVITVPLT